MEDTPNAIGRKSSTTTAGVLTTFVVQVNGTLHGAREVLNDRGYRRVTLVGITCDLFHNILLATRTQTDIATATYYTTGRRFKGSCNVMASPHVIMTGHFSQLPTNYQGAYLSFDVEEPIGIVLIFFGRICVAAARKADA